MYLGSRKPKGLKNITNSRKGCLCLRNIDISFIYDYYRVRAFGFSLSKNFKSFGFSIFWLRHKKKSWNDAHSHKSQELWKTIHQRQTNCIGVKGHLCDLEKKYLVKKLQKYVSVDHIPLFIIFCLKSCSIYWYYLILLCQVYDVINQFYSVCCINQRFNTHLFQLNRRYYKRNRKCKSTCVKWHVRVNTMQLWLTILIVV